MKKGFTMIEMLIAVAAVGLLLLLGFFSYKQSIDKSNDASRKSDLVVLSRAFEEYYNNNGCYPSISEWSSVSCDQSGFNDLVSQMPCDPVSNEKYVYQTTDNVGDYCIGLCGDCSGYRILTTLESLNDPSILELGCDPKQGCGIEIESGKVPNWGLAMGTTVIVPGFTLEKNIQNDQGGDGSQDTVPQNPTPTPALTLPYSIPGYALDDTKFFANYAVVFYEDPKLPSGRGWIDVSLKSDFPSGGDTYISIASAGDGIMGWTGSLSDVSAKKFTSKKIGFISRPNLWGKYTQSCGEIVYWRLHDAYHPEVVSKTFTNTIDCETKVGVISPPLSWYDVFNYANYYQKVYDERWDFDESGLIDWDDYTIGAFSTRTRSGGWQPPE